MSTDNTMGITNTEFCSHGQHLVKADQITWIYPKTGGRRRICDACKAKVEAANKAMKEKA